MKKGGGKEKKEKRVGSSDWGYERVLKEAEFVCVGGIGAGFGGKGLSLRSCRLVTSPGSAALRYAEGGVVDEGLPFREK